MRSIRKRVSELAIDIGALGAGKAGDGELQAKLNQQFDFQQLRAGVFDAGAMANDLMPSERKVFTVDPAQSLLGAMSAFAKERRIKLLFYRVKRRPNLQNEVVQSEELRAYTMAFKSLLKNICVFLCKII